MTDGEGVALALVGAGVVGAGAWFLFFRQPAAVQAGTFPAIYPPAYPYTALNAPTPPGAPPPAPSAASQLMSGINGLNQAGCQAAASKVGAGQLAAIGCSDFIKYATPLGLAELANTAVQKIPVVGPAVGKVEHAVSNVVSAPLNVAKSAVNKVLSFF